MIAVAAAFFAAIAIYIFIKKSSKADNIPGPRGFPILGNVTQLDWGNPFLQLSKWAKEYGSIFYLKVGQKNLVVVNSIEGAYEVFIGKGWQFAGRSQGYRTGFLSRWTFGLIGSDPTPSWKAARKLSHSTLKQFGPGMGKLEELALQMTTEFLDAFEKTNGMPIDPKDEIENATLQMISLMVFGSVSHETCQQIRLANELLLQGTANGLTGQMLDAFPWMRYFGNSAYKLIAKGTHISTDVWKEFYGMVHKRDFQHEDTLPVGFVLLEKQSEFNDFSAAKQEDFMRTVCTQLNIAGNSTTARTFYAFLNILLHYPHIMENIQREIDEVLGETPVGLQHQINMPYTKATLLELLRYTSILATGLIHKALQDSSIEGYRIKKDTLVMVNHWYLHHDEGFWKQPYEFLPDRFLDAEGHLVVADHPNRKHLLPFGAGPRVCVGEMLAQARLFLWTVAVLQKFTLKPEDPTALVPCDPRSYIPDIVLQPLSYKVCFISRHKD